jgi:hypothetical protein
MEISDLQRETYNAERMGELGRIILSQSEQLAAAIRDNERLKAENEALKASATPATPPQPEGPAQPTPTA